MKPKRYRYGVGFVPVFLFILCVSTMFCLPTAAAALQGSLELRCSIERENNTVLLAGDEYALCMVATLEETQGELQYQTLPAYSFADCDWAQCSAAQLREKALQLAPKAQKRKDFAATQQTDANGTVIFRDLTPGLYLVVRTNPAPENTAYTSDPFLVSIPTVVNGTAAYQVVAEPKFSWDTKTSKPAVPSLKPDSSLPQTGQLIWPIPILIAMGLSLILLGGWLQRKSDHEK